VSRSGPMGIGAAILLSLSCVACGDDGPGVPPPPDGGLDGASDAAVGDAGPVVSALDGSFPPPRFGACTEPESATAVGALPFRETLLLGGGAPRDRGRPSTACAGASDAVAADAVFAIEAPGPGTITVRTDLPGTEPWLDTVVYIRDGCDGASREIGCDDDGGARGGASRLFAEVAGAGPLLVFVDGATADDRGTIEVLIGYTPVPASSGEGADTCAEATELVFVGDAASLRMAVGAGDTTDASNDLGCAGVPTTYDLPDEHYAMVLDAPADVIIEVTPGPTFDAAFYLLPDCASTEAAACHDQGPIGVAESTLVQALPAGRWILGIDSFFSPGFPEWNEGPYELRVVLLPPTE